MTTAAAMSMGPASVGPDLSGLTPAGKREFSRAEAAAMKASGADVKGAGEKLASELRNWIDKLLAAIVHMFRWVLVSVCNLLGVKLNNDAQAAAPALNQFAPEGHQSIGGRPGDWELPEKGTMAALAPSQAGADILDGFVNELRPAHHQLGKPTYLLPGDEAEEVADKAITQLVDGIIRRLEDPKVIEQLDLILSEGKDAEAFELVAGPSLEEFHAHAAILKAGMFAEISDIVKDQLPDEGRRRAAVNEIIEALPVVGNHTALDQDAINLVVAHLRNKGTEIEALTKYKALIGASAGVLNGTFDPLKDVVADKPFIQKDYKFRRATSNVADAEHRPALGYARPKA